MPLSQLERKRTDRVAARQRRPVPRIETAERADLPYLVDVMSPRQHLEFRLLAGAWGLGLVVFYLWWFRLEHVTGWVPFLVNTLVLSWTLALPAYFFFFVGRMQKPNPQLPIPDNWRVAMVTTRAPSEPFELVQRTLLAMLEQTYPHDTWLADEDPTDEIIDWCQEHGVLLSTRRNAPDYHRPAWPRRAKCKEGNLAYFYDHYGYDNYDFVVQLDADHVPTDGYLEEMIRPFVDPAVGYVSAPSICSTNAATSWSARGRLFSEAMLHGPLQCGYTNGFAPLCIGSHYSVRTEALREIGGLGPELAEDHSTTLMMNGHGWRGVHAIDAIAHGEGPPTLSDCIVQEFQWSRSLVVVMLTLMPRYWRKLTWPLRLQFLFCQLWYPLFAITMLLGLAIPVIAVMTQQPFVRVGYLDFLLHALPVTCLTLGVMLFLKRHGWLRPANAPVLSWETVLFQLVRWPWACYGSLMGAVMTVRPRPVVFRVTPKGTTSPVSLQWSLLVPYLAIVAFSFSPALAAPNAGKASGYYFFLILTQLTYCVTLFSIVWIHRHEASQLAQ